MNPHGFPYLRFIAPFLFGIVLGAWLEVPFPWLDLALLVGGLFGIWLSLRTFSYRFRWVFGLYVHALLMAFGYYHVLQYNELRAPNHFSETLQQPNQYYIGTVYEAPSVGTKARLRVRLEAAATHPDSFQAVSGNVLLYLDVDAFSDSIQYGDRLGFQADIQPTEPAKNPQAFDYARYLHFQNIHYQAFIKSGAAQHLSRNNGWWIWKNAYQSRTSLLRLLQHYFPTRDEYAVASALLVGYTDDLSDDMRAAYAETGSMHALAVSGTHIGLLYVGLMLIVGRLRLRGRMGRLLEMGLIMSAIWAFTFLTGATASVLRASVMFSVYMIGKAFWRSTAAWNVLPASAFFLLLYNPYLLFNVGFQLSYAAVAGMVFFYPRLYKMFPPMSRYLDEPLQVLLVGVSAQLGTLPLSLCYFHQFPVYFWLAGWVVVLVGAVFLWGGAMLVLLDACSQTLAEWTGWLLYQLLYWMNKIIFYIQKLPGSVIRDLWVPGWAALLLYMALVFVGAAMVRKKGIWVGCFMGIMVLLGIGHQAAFWQHQTQQSLVLYQVNKASMLDLFAAECAVSLRDSVTPKQEMYAAQSHRIACGIRGKTTVFWQDTAEFTTHNILINKPFLQFNDQRLALIDDARWITQGQPSPMRVDVLVLSKSPRVRIADCRERFPHAFLVLDASNSMAQIKRWRAECDAAGWAYHDVRSMGAWGREGPLEKQ